MGTKPAVSILINAFGRTWLLAEALKAAHDQVYDGDIEIVVINDLQEQSLRAPELHLPGRTWAVHNLPKRLGSLGEKRNAGIERCSHRIIVMADDDDIMLPWSVDTLLTGHSDTDMPTWASKYAYTTGWPRGEVAGAPEWSCHTEWNASAQHGLITKAHHEVLGGFKHFSTKDDIDFMHRAYARFGDGIFVDVMYPEYLYRWGTTAHHLAGTSDCASSWEAAYQRALHDIRTGFEPRGDVQLQPALKADYVAALRAAGALP